MAKAIGHFLPKSEGRCHCKMTKGYEVAYIETMSRSEAHHETIQIAKIVEKN